MNGTAGDQHFVWQLTVAAQDIALWRKQVGVAIDLLGGGRDAVEVAQLGVSELLANVVTHVDDPSCRLEVLRVERAACVRLFDRSRQVPAVRVPDWEAERGRGLWLLREVADGMGYALTGSGKWVWFRVALPDAGQVAA